MVPSVAGPDWTFPMHQPTLHFSMSGSRWFVPQATLEMWLDRESAQVRGQTLHLPRPRRQFRLEPAVRFTCAIPEGPTQMVGRVMTESRITELGGELLEDSVLFGDVGFSVENGYVAREEEL